MISSQFVQALAERHGLRPDQVGIHGSYGGSPESFKKHGIVANGDPEHPTEYNNTFTVSAHHRQAMDIASHYATVTSGNGVLHNPVGKDNQRPGDGTPRTGRGNTRGSMVFVDLTKAPASRPFGSGGYENMHEGTIPPEAIIHVQRHSRSRTSHYANQDRPMVPLTDPRERENRLRRFRRNTGREVAPSFGGAFGDRLV